MYKVLRSIFFLLSPEAAHYFAMRGLKFICSIKPLYQLLSSIYRTNPLPVKAFGLNFINPIGLGAGFDKNAKYMREMEALGFGHMEIGTVTPEAQEGNEPPRLFRIPSDKALINRMGFNNEGCDQITERLKTWRKKNPDSKLIIGGNIGKNKRTHNDEAWKDYAYCFNALHPFVDYFTVNVSSPNTPGLRELQGKDALKKILTNLQTENYQHALQRPILLKIAPDIEETQADEIAQLAVDIKLSGLIICNTTTGRTKLSETGLRKAEKIGDGGLSGAPLKIKSSAIVKYISEKTKGKIPIIASGGIFNADDARQKLNAGAVLFQVWTGFVYEGPAIAKKITDHLYGGSTGKW